MRLSKLASCFLILFTSLAAFSAMWVPAGPAPEPVEKTINEGRTIFVTDFTPDDSQKTSLGSKIDSRVSTQEVARGIKAYISNFLELSFVLLKNRNNKNFHWVDMGGGAGHAQIESYFPVPIEAIPPIQINLRNSRDEPDRFAMVDFMKDAQGNFRFAPLFKGPTYANIPINHLQRVNPAAQYKTTNVSFLNVVQPYIEGDNLGSKAEVLAQKRQVYIPWRERVMAGGNHREVFGQLVKDIP